MSPCAKCGGYPAAKGIPAARPDEWVMQCATCLAVPTAGWGATALDALIDWEQQQARASQ